MTECETGCGCRRYGEVIEYSFHNVFTGIPTAPIAMVVVEVYVEEALNTTQNPQNEP